MPIAHDILFVFARLNYGLKKGGNPMCYKLTAKIVICLTMILFFLSISTNVFAGGSVIFKWGKDIEPEQHQVKQKHKKKGPPAHAPAHGYRAKHKYRYYPSNNVYHDTEKGLYFYLKGDNWEVGASLPALFRDGLGESVALELETDRPYLHHAEHVKQYPPKKSKGKKHKKWAKK
jgi:hypothetical protein